MATRAEQFAQSQNMLKNAGIDINKYNAAIASGSSVEDAMRAGGWTGQKASTSTTTPATPTKTTTNATTTSTPTYSSYTPVKNGGPADGYANATERNMATGGSEFIPQSNKTQTSTPISGKPDYSKSVRDAWDKKSYQEQQDLLNKNPGLKEQIQKIGGTFKTSEAAPTTTDTGTTTGAETPKQEQWDYQDNSPERMAEIAANLEGYKQTMPYLFNDKRAFDDFFINGKGRSKEQIDFLNDWFYKNQKYGKYDALTPDSIGYGIAYGDIPEDYLTMLKTTDPAKYQAVLQAKQDAEDKIKDKTALDTTSVLSGDSEATITSKAIEWLKTQGLFLDKDGNLIDDRTENYATDEEKQYAKDAADIIARNLDIDNTVKHTYEDLVNRYPGATKATLMAMAQDTNSDLLREKENNNVELTRLQGYMDYMQSERQERNRIGENAINKLQNQYGMYYQYTPEGMSELAQAQYAATNITLDQADNGTDAQKQMALQNVLDGYYQKYGDIIQRSEAQVINDVMALAKQKGISLSQALEENFLKYLRQKPGFSQLSSVQTEPYVVKVGDVAYKYNQDTDTFDIIGGSSVSGGGTVGAGGYQFSEAEVRTGDTIGNDINSIGHILASDDGLRVGTYHNEKNGYTYNVYADREDGIKATENLLRKGYYGMSLQDAAQKWIGKGKDISGAKKVIQSKGLGLNDKLSDANVRKFIEAMGTWEGTLKGGQSLDDWAKSGKNDFSEYKQMPTTEADDQNQKFSNLTGWNNDGYSNSLIKDYELYISDPSKVSKTDIESKYSPMGMTYYDFTTQAQNYARTGMKDKYVNSVSSSLEAAIELYEYINGAKSDVSLGDLLTKGVFTLFDGGSAQKGLTNKALAYIPGTKQKDAKSYFDALNNRETLQKLIETKAQGATYGAMSEGEWKLLASAANLLDRNQSGATFQKNLEDLIYALSTAVQEGGGKLPTNYYKSSASNMIMQGENSGRRNAYKEDNSPFYADIDYSSYSTSGPSEI